MMQVLKRGAVAALVLLFAGCAAAPSHSVSGEGSTMMLVLGNGTAEPGSHYEVELGVIAGQLMGSPKNAPSLFIPARAGKQFTISMADAERALAEAAEPASPKMLANDVKVMPADTRFMRLSTFIVSGAYRERVLGGGFYDRSGVALLLVYVDRACTIKGVEKTRSGYKLAMDLQIPKAGMVWLRSEKISDNEGRLSVVEAPIDAEFRTE